MHLKQPGFTYSARGPFTKNKGKIQKFTGDSRYIYKNELGKACFQDDMTYGGFKDLSNITAWDKFLRDEAFRIAKNLKYNEYLRGLASMVYKFFDKKISCSNVATLANKSSSNLLIIKLSKVGN